MAIPTPVNGQITDAITQANLTATGNAPAVAIGILQQAIAHSLALAAHNATNAQQQLNITAQAVATAGAALLFGNASAVELTEIADEKPQES